MEAHVNFRGSYKELSLLLEKKKKIIELDCSNSKLPALPFLPDTLEILNCSHNKISEIIQLPPRLKILICSYNAITEIKYFPETLEIIQCEFNNIEKLPNLQESLQYLNCQRNNLTILPPLPFRLEYLNCGMNRITQLPSIPASLKSLSCCFTDIVIFPSLPKLNYLAFNNTIWLYQGDPFDLRENKLLYLCLQKVMTDNLPLDYIPQDILDHNKELVRYIREIPLSAVYYVDYQGGQIPIGVQ